AFAIVSGSLVVVFGKNTRKQPVAHHNALDADGTQIKLIHYKISEIYGAIMVMFDAQISSMLSGTLFRKILNNEPITLFEYNALTGMLINANVPFDASFASGTRKNPASLQLTIHLNPSTTLVSVISLEPGASVFSPSP
ncbi:MAG: hypothetical protein FWC70_13370, partial [Defluviitaleaceae bacterium]|nr:hypothetical protein [Defluviitaleaceae bacterium]